MTDRDYFAAAALTGLLAAPTDKDRSMDYWARLAFEAADAMLAARGPVAETPEPQHVAGTCRGERQDAAAGVTLTDAERGALKYFSAFGSSSPLGRTYCHALENLLARLGGGA
jgi:hypothetical protein